MLFNVVTALGNNIIVLGMWDHTSKEYAAFISRMLINPEDGRIPP
jgi:hypothetical protein